MNKYNKKLPYPLNILTTPLNNNLSKLIYQKDVIIVGPSNNLVGLELGTMIDNADIVVRIKKGCPVPNNMVIDYGTKTDLLYTNLRIDNDTNSLNILDLLEIKKNGVKFICYPYPTETNNLDYRFRKNWKNTAHKIKKYLPITNNINFNDFITIHKYMGCRPTTGLLTIIDILKYNPKSVLIMGFTFRLEWLQNNSNIYHPSYKNNKQIEYSIDTTNTIHSIEKEWYFFQYLLLNIPKLKYHQVT